MSGEVSTSSPSEPADSEPRLIDLRHLGNERVIGSWIVGDILIDPGPTSCMPALLEGLGERRPRVIALTHIHLDHAGASGSLLRRFPEAELWVHERGAPHMVDPAKLLASAARLYGDRMQTLWGDFLPVPPERMRVLSGGERLEGLSVAYTPGHASHHVSYLWERHGWAFAGDVAGVRISQTGPVLAPTPPPDIDFEVWRDSLDTIEAWRPTVLVPTHFGSYRDVTGHLERLRACLDGYERLAASFDRDRFVQALQADMKGGLNGTGDPVDLIAYEQAMPPDQTYQGVERYLRKLAAQRMGSDP